MNARIETTDDRIRKAGWFKGTKGDWDRLTTDENQTLAFNGTGCEVAYPTWTGPVECVHTGCQIRRGEIPQTALTNRILRYEIDRGWLRFGKESTEGRARLAATVRAIRRACRMTGIYDPWKLPGGWMAIVDTAVA